MKKLTFTIFNNDDTVHSYLFNVTRVEAQSTIEKLNAETKEYHYYMDGYLEN